MQLPEQRVSNYLSQNWKEQYKQLLEEEHWTGFIQNLQQQLLNTTYKRELPHFNEEVTPAMESIVALWKTEFNEQFKNSSSWQEAWASTIEAMPFEYILIILGQRQTPASAKDSRAIPPLKKTLIKSARQAFNKQISIATRAWEKHAGRSDDNFWGEVKGTPAQKEEHVQQLVSKMIDGQTWWNVFVHYKHQQVYEIRVPSGHGIRWTADGNSIIGFLEPFLNV